MSILRYNPDFRVGLSNEQVEERKISGLVNYNDQVSTKSIKEIIKSNFFTYFNLINVVLGVAIIGTGIYGGEIVDAIKNCLFMGVVICNSIISIIQEIISKKTIDKLSVLAEAKVIGVRDSKEVSLGIEE